MDIVLQILSIIGIVLLSILGLILILALLILFVPIRYRACGKKDTETLLVEARVTYLLHMVSFRFTLYDKETSWFLKLFGIKIMGEPKKEKTKKKNRKNNDSKSNDSKIHDEKNHNESKPDESCMDELNKDEPNKEKPFQEVRETKISRVKTDDEEFEEGSSQNSGKDRSFLEKIQYKFRTICDKIKNIFSNIAYYKEVLTKKENKKFYGRVKTRLAKIIKSICPRKLNANLHIGTGAPDTTGYVCAVYGILLPVCGNNINLEPDFDEKVFEGDFSLKGKITIFTLLRHALAVAFDKQLRIFLKELKREE